MARETDSLSFLTEKVLEFRDERDWKQFHAPKNLAAALNVEAAELLELYLWTDSPRKADAIKEEAADVLYHLLLFCHETGIDLGQAFLDKLKQSGAKYPVDKAKGSPKKYTDFE